MANGLSFPSHEARATDLIANSALEKLIQDEWGIQTTQVTRLISGQASSGNETVIQSIVDSVLDVDKLDYLRRDSVHCGVTYGTVLDVNRLLDSLHVDAERNTITVNQKGRTYLMSLLTARNLMYQEVYWHKTVRACTAMFKRYFYELFERGLFSTNHADSIFKHPDAVFLQELSKIAGGPTANLRSLIAPLLNEGRSLYKPAYIYTHGDPNEGPQTMKFFERILHSDYAYCVKASLKVCEALKGRFSDLLEWEILADQTPFKEGKEYYDLKRLRVWNLRKSHYEDLPDGMLKLDSFLRENQRAFIFCNPRLYDKLRSLSKAEWEILFAEVNTALTSRAKA